MILKCGAVYELGLYGLDIFTGQEIVNVLHVRNPIHGSLVFNDNLAGSDSQTYLNNFVTWWGIRNLHISNHYALFNMTLRRIGGITVSGPTNARIRKWAYSDYDTLVGSPTLMFGGITGEACPNVDAVSIRKVTGLVGRSRRGGLRLGPVPEASQVNGKIDVTAYSDLVGDWVGIILGATNGATAAPDQPMNPVVASKLLAGPTNGSFTFTESLTWANDVTQFVVGRNCGTQLSRKVRQRDIINT